MDVVVFDPATLLVPHVRHGHPARYCSPVAVALQYDGRITL
jgi:hypothetical protein